MLFVISAPSGAGKTTIIRKLFKLLPELMFSVSATTREKRPDETNGKDYYFLSEKDFNQKVAKGDFIEWEEVHGNLYGTLKSDVENYMENLSTAGSDIVFDVDVKGALSIKKLYPESVTIFIDASKEDLLKRLKGRKTEPEEAIKKRLKRIELELKFKNKFDNVVFNKTGPEGIESAVREIVSIIKKSKSLNN
jgi:guanylate kinase